MKSLRIALVISVVSVLAAIACSQQPDEVTAVAGVKSTSGGSPLTEDAFKELITLADIPALVASGVSLETEYRDFREMTSRADPSQVESIDSWYGLTVISSDGNRALSFSVIDFDSASAAVDHYEKLRAATPGMQEMDPPIGDSSASVQINDKGLGGSLAFTMGDKSSRCTRRSLKVSLPGGSRGHGTTRPADCEPAMTCTTPR